MCVQTLISNNPRDKVPICNCEVWQHALMLGTCIMVNPFVLSSRLVLASDPPSSILLIQEEDLGQLLTTPVTFFYSHFDPSYGGGGGGGWQRGRGRER